MWLLYCPKCYEKGIKSPLQADMFADYARCADCEFKLPRERQVAECQGDHQGIPDGD